VLGMSERTVRRGVIRYEAQGHGRVFRTGARREARTAGAPDAEVAALEVLHAGEYAGWNVRRFLGAVTGRAWRDAVLHVGEEPAPGGGAGEV